MQTDYIMYIKFENLQGLPNYNGLQYIAFC